MFDPRWNVIRLPSGDQRGLKPFSAIRCWFVPSGFMSQMLLFRTNAMAPFFPGHAALVVLTLDSRAANDAIDTATTMRRTTHPLVPDDTFQRWRVYRPRGRLCCVT